MHYLKGLREYSTSYERVACTYVDRQLFTVDTAIGDTLVIQQMIIYYECKL